MRAATFTMVFCHVLEARHFIIFSYHKSITYTTQMLAS
jgi:hypothetical protein